MRDKLKLLHSKRLIRFVIVGITNAAISFGILNLAFYKLGQTKIMSSIIATTCALIFSFFLNRHYVFSDKSKRAHKQFIAFAVVTTSGTLIVLNIIYIITLKLLNGHEAFFMDIIKSFTNVTLSKNFVDINLSTVVGAIGAMIWNYNGYKYFVFLGAKSKNNVIAAEHEKQAT